MGRSQDRELSATSIPSFITVEFVGVRKHFSKFDKNDIAKLRLTSSP